MVRALLPILALVAMLGIACGGSDDPTTTATPTVEVTATPTATPEATPTPVAACTFETATGTVFASVLQVVTDTGGGTAFAIGDGEFLTAAHVVVDASSISLRNTRTEAEATIVGLEEDTDIAILRSDGLDIEPVRFGHLDDLAAGQSVAVAGYPTYVEDEPSVVSGLLSKVVEDPDLGFGTFLQTDAAVNPGNSGGPMFNECGDVIGMVVVKIVDTAVEGISWAVAENTLQSALPRVRRKGPPEPGGAIDPWFVEVEPESRYIANTGGSGVSFRDDCLDSARLEGSWPEGAQVVLSHDGIGFCEGWSVVLDDVAVSWVQDQYLAASPPSVAQPPPSQPTAAPPAPTATAAPPAPTATQAPVGPPQTVVDYLTQIRNDLLDFSARMTTIIRNHNDELITSETASAQSYALETEARAYSDQVLLDSNSLAGISDSCEWARQWFGDALFYRGLSAGYSGLSYEFWPNVSFKDADDTAERSWDSFETADGYFETCLAGG